MFKSEEGKKIIKTTYYISQTIKVIYNPFYLLDIIFRHKLLTNI